jgi:hypothetical protein
MAWWLHAFGDFDVILADLSVVLRQTAARPELWMPGLA